jgi:ATP-dependent Zn protease
MRDVSQTEIYAQPLEHWFGTIQVLWAGDIATEVLMGKRWTGAYSNSGGSDLERVEQLKKILAAHGVFAGRVPLDTMNIYDDPEIKEAARAYDLEAQAGTRYLLEANRPALEALRDGLIEKDELNSEEVYDIFEEYGI